MLLTLQRILQDGAHTEGTLLVAGETMHTMELPWLDGAADESCVPAGEYELSAYESPEKGLVYRLHNPALGVYGHGLVPEGARSAIEMHPGNWTTDSLGCILVGLSLGELLNPKTGRLEPAVLESQDAMTKLRALLGNIMAHSLIIQQTI
jgi:hypothetical protein